MKKLIYAFAGVALAGVLALTSCSQEEGPSTLTLEPTQMSLKVGDNKAVTAKGVDVIDKWELSNDSVATYEVNPQDSRNASVVAVAPGEVTLTAFAGDQTAICVIKVEGEKIELPAIEAPVEPNKVTVVVRVPAGSVDCAGVGATGDGAAEFYVEGETAKWAPSQPALFTAVEGYENWWQITLTALEGQPISDIQMKVLGLSAPISDTNWANQWGKGDNVKILQGVGDLGAGPEPQLTAMEGASVVYLDIADWQSTPCSQKNAAGDATFTLKVENLPAEATAITICGDFGADSEFAAWTPGAGPVFTQSAEDPTVWTGSCPVPAGFQYKYVWSADGTSWDWDHAAAGNNIQMAVDLKAQDTISEWVGGAAAPDPEV